MSYSQEFRNRVKELLARMDVAATNAMVRIYLRYCSRTNKACFERQAVQEFANYGVECDPRPPKQDNPNTHGKLPHELHASIGSTNIIRGNYRHGSGYFNRGND